FDNLSNSQIMFSNSNIKFIEGNILDNQLLDKSLKNIEIVIHLAAQISVSDSIRDPENTMKINVDGTKNILTACIENNIKNFIGISTAAIFGNTEEILSENSSPNPISPYGKSKLIMEELIIDFSKKYDLNSVIFRFFNLYGPRQSTQYAGVITKFLKNLQENKPLEIFGDGNQTRDFIHIDDAIQCIHLAINNLEGKNGRVYNIGSGTSTSISKLASLLLELTGKNMPIQFKPGIKGDIIHSRTSINLAKNELNFEPKISLEEGLSRFLQDMKENNF
ncbi:MAG: NAD-dependent epimerase/dehydratase family protein, partial [Nitrospina sp.]|nr:NAD-dependent epimerase/dehydratase family protein [Nitrospina sp.]